MSLTALHQAIEAMREALKLDQQGHHLRSFDQYSRARLLLQILAASNERNLYGPAISITLQTVNQRWLRKQEAFQSSTAISGFAQGASNKSSLTARSEVNTKDTSFEDIIGQQEAKQALWEASCLPFKLPAEAFVGCRQATTKIMLYGPPGTGKTSLAKACRTNLQTSLGRPVQFFQVQASSILSKFCGESEQQLAATFDEAKLHAPSILFFDEMDTLAPPRDGSSDKAMPRLLGELLIALSSLQPRDKVIVIAATNRLDCIDEAVLRRFDRRIQIALPTAEDRFSMITFHLSGKLTHTLSENEVKQIAEHTEGWSGSDIEQLCREAAMKPLREVASACVQQSKNVSTDSIRAINWNDFEHAYGASMPPAIKARQQSQQSQQPQQSQQAQTAEAQCHQNQDERQQHHHPHPQTHTEQRQMVSAPGVAQSEVHIKQEHGQEEHDQSFAQVEEQCPHETPLPHTHAHMHAHAPGQEPGQELEQSSTSAENAEKCPFDVPDSSPRSQYDFGSPFGGVVAQPASQPDNLQYFTHHQQSDEPCHEVMDGASTNNNTACH